jgi:hypothetical protein
VRDLSNFMHDMHGSQISKATAAVQIRRRLRPRWLSNGKRATLLGEVDDVNMFAPCVLVTVSVLLQRVSCYYLFVNEDDGLGGMPRIGNKCFSLSFPPLAWGPL